MKYLTKDYLTKLDKSINMIPLYADCMYKSIFTYDLDILKEFIISELNMNLDSKKTRITLLNNELPKNKIKEYKKIIDIFVKLNNNIYVNLELNNSSFNKYLIVRNEVFLSKIFSYIFETGDNKNKFLDKKLIQINLNTKNFSKRYGSDTIVPYGIDSKSIYIDNKKMILKYLAYYRNLYYNSNIILEKSELWLVVILSKSLSELYDLLDKLLSKEKRDKFIRKVIEMSTDAFILSEWEREKLDELEELARLEDARVEGIQEIILNMFNENASLDVISKYTKLTKEEIEDIINNFNNNKNK